MRPKKRGRLNIIQDWKKKKSEEKLGMG